MREKDTTTWKDASEYATVNQVFSSLLGQNYEFTKTKTAAVNAEPNAWKDTFTGLPSALVNTTGSTPAYTLLEYRVVETQIVYTVPGGTPGETQTTVTVTVNDQGVYTLQPVTLDFWRWPCCQRRHQHHHQHLEDCGSHGDENLERQPEQIPHPPHQ